MTSRPHAPQATERLATVGLWHRLGTPLLAYLAAVAAILALTWPWALHFSGEFVNHWDPPFHAWKLELIARAILRGDPWLLATESPVIYPYGGTLYYEALQWPPAWLAALLLACTNWPSELVYHLVLVACWALSAPCMAALLREVRLGRTAAFTGALLFCIVPHRISYLVEFQMQLIYAIPLYYLFLVRLLRRPRILDGAGLALAWWLQAVSELYQAVFLLITTPFIIASFVSARPGLLRARRLWRAGLAAALVGAASLYPLLTPYFLQRAGGSVRRLMSEVPRHAAQPLTYLQPFNHLTPWTLDARRAELSLYPTVAVLLLALIGLAAGWRQGVAGGRIDRRMRRSLALLAASGATFVILTLLLHNGIGAASDALPRCWDFSAILCVLAGTLLVMLPVRAPSRTLFLRGLLGAAILCFFLSLGPTLSIGTYDMFVADARVSTGNTVYQTAHRTWLPLLSSFRVVSRFGVVVLFFLICLAATTLDRLWRAGAARPATRGATAALLLLLVGLESLAHPMLKNGFRPVDRGAESPLIRRLEARREPFVLAMFPMGDRMDEGMRMFGLLRDRHLSVYAWGGFIPSYTYGIREAVKHLQVERIHAGLSILWPDCLLLVDRTVHLPASEASPRRFPEYPVASEAGMGIDFVGLLGRVATPIDQDGRYTLMRLAPAAPAARHLRLFRADMGRRSPIVEATVTSERPGRLTVTLNGQPLATRQVEGGRAVFRHELDPRHLRRSGYNALAFELDGAPFSLETFALARREP